jgi:hypothetical protein
MSTSTAFLFLVRTFLLNAILQQNRHYIDRMFTPVAIFKRKVDDAAKEWHRKTKDNDHIKIHSKLLPPLFSGLAQECQQTRPKTIH